MPARECRRAWPCRCRCHEGHARGQRPGLAQRRGRRPGGRHRERARRARRERRAVGAGDRWRLVDGQGEGLGGVGGDAVGGGDRQRVGAAGTRRGRAGERGGAVAVVHEGHARGQRTCLGQRGRVGNPVVVTVNVPAVPGVNAVLSALVIAGAWSTVRVKVWVALGVTPLAA